MKLSPTLIQGIWESQNPILQLPHVSDADLRHWYIKGRSVKSVQQFVSASQNDRKHIMRIFSSEEQNDILSVCFYFPHITMTVKSEVVDDDDSGVFTAGAIVTVTVHIVRKNSGEVYHVMPSAPPPPKEKKKQEDERDEASDSLQKKSKWTKEQTQMKKKGGKPDSRKGKKNAPKFSNKHASDAKSKKVEDLSDDSEDSQTHSDESEAGDADTESHREERSEVDEDAEWERFQKGMVKKEKALEGQSKVSHSVHCPLFPDDKQEYWWVYVCDRKKKELTSVPYNITNLVNEEEVQLKMTAPPKPGVYTYQVSVCAIAYICGDQVNYYWKKSCFGIHKC